MKRLRPETALRIVASLFVVVLVAAPIALAQPTSDAVEPAKATYVLSSSVRNDAVSCESQPAGAICPVSIQLGGTLAAGAVGVVPGDTLTRLATITNDGRTDLASISLRVTPARVTPLRLRIDACSTAWIVSATNSLVCDSRSSNVVADRNVATAGLDLGNLASLRRHGVDHLRFTIAMPNDAPLAENGTETQIVYEVIAVQATGPAKGKK